MKSILILLIIGIPQLLFAQNSWTNKTRVLPDSLRKLTTGILVYHSNNPNYPILNDSLAYYDGKYIWKHSTFAQSMNEDLEIIKAGSYIWFSESGWFENMLFDKTTFIEKFSCPEGILKKGISYCYQKNYRFGNELYAGDALWYVIAKNKEGQIFKGYGILETEVEILK